MELFSGTNDQSVAASIFEAISNYGKHSIKTIKIGETIWFRGKDVADILEYKDTSHTIRDLVPEKNKATLEDVLRGVEERRKLSPNERRTVYLREAGVIDILISSKRPNKHVSFKWFKDNFGIDCSVISKLYKEQETIGQICRALAFTDCKVQYSVGKYRIDLYLPKYCIAIECDEYGHSDRDPSYEKKRQNFIEEQLNCVFIRYNPDSEKFDVFQIISEIIQAILAYTEAEKTNSK